MLKVIFVKLYSKVFLTNNKYIIYRNYTQMNTSKYNTICVDIWKIVQTMQIECT